MALLPDRAVISVAGEGQAGFLDGLLTCDVVIGALRYGALLTPQGKVVTDMMVHGFADRIVLDVPDAAADDLLRRLTIYRLRAPVTLSRTTEVVVIGEGLPDPRGSVSGPVQKAIPGAMGLRGIAASAMLDAVALERHTEARIAAGVPEAGIDFALGDAFPHDMNMDLLGGVDFAKGCFVGQEVVSRMKHRGTARRRIVLVEADRSLPIPGTAITANGRAAGRLGTVLGSRGLAMVRIDRVGADAMAGDVPVRLSPPPGAPFVLTAPPMAEDAAAVGEDGLTTGPSQKASVAGAPPDPDEDRANRADSSDRASEDAPA